MAKYFRKKRSKLFAHKIANNIIKNNKVPTVKLINRILSCFNIKITNIELIKLLNLPKYSINTKSNEEMN